MTELNALQKMMPSSTSTAVEPVNSAKELKIGQILVLQGKMNPGQVDLVLKEQENSSMRFGEVAVRLGFVKTKDIDDALAQQYGYSQLDASTSNLPAKVVAAFTPNSPFVEALRGLRSQLMLRWFDGSPGQTSLAVTSVDRGDGKSFITANLGVLFAQLGERTLVIDADLRHPTQNQIFGLHNKMGLSGLLAGRAGMEEVIDVPSIRNLSVLPSGPLPPNPQELLGSHEFAELLNYFSSRYNVILVDTPSAQEASDAHVVAQRTRSVLLVGRKDKTRSAELSQLAGIMSNSGIQILGATLNSM